MKNNIIITIKKEIRSVLRDKRTLRNIFLVPLLIPIMIFFYGNMYDNMDTKNEEYNIAINYDLDEAEEKIFKELNVNTKKYNSLDEMKEEYKKDNISLYIDYNKDKNKYTIYSDESENGMKVSSIVGQYFKMYNKILTDKYLVEHEIDLEKAYNQFELENITLDEKTNFMIVIVITVVIMYVIFSIASSTSSMATSITATERENGTLETILTFPIKFRELIMGKYLSSVIVGALSSLFGLVIGLISISVAKNIFDSYKSISLNVNFITLAVSILIIVLASFFISGVALILTIYSKSTKEAQSSTQFLTLLCIVPMFITLMNFEITQVYYFIPIFNYNQVLMNLFTESINWTNIIYTIISTMILIGIILKYVINTYSSEKVLFAD